MATTTPNFGWSVPTSTDLVKDGATAIETLGDSIDASLVDLKGGTSGQVLKKNSNTDMDFVWSADSAGMTNPMTTTGDTIYSSSGSTPARLGIGSAGQVLTVASGIPSWATPAGGSTFSGTFVYNSADQSIANSTNTTLTWNTESFDVDGYHSTATNTSRFTVPTGKTGYFLFTANIGWGNSASGIRQLFFLKNGTAIATIESTTSSAGFVEQSPSITVSLSATDYLEIRVWQNSGGNLDVRNASSASITYLGA